MLIALKEEEKRHIQQILKGLAKQAGSQLKLAQSLNIKKPSISQLISGKYLPSARVCVLIESKYGIKKEDLRPDIFLLN